jgi:hypothetical protein
MRKLFDLKKCSEDEPMDPGPGSSAEEWYDYFKEWSGWLKTCMMEPEVWLPDTPPPSLPPNGDHNKFEDSKGYVWKRTSSSKGLDIKLDLFEMPVALNTYTIDFSDAPIIIGIRISFNEYSILTSGPKGLSIHVVKRNKIRLTNLLNAMNNHTKLPHNDLTKVSEEFWHKHDMVMS